MANAWAVIDHKETEDDILDVEWFHQQVFISTIGAVYRVLGERVERVDFGKDPPKNCYQLTATKDVMWSNGEFDIMSFDGAKWTRIV